MTIGAPAGQAGPGRALPGPSPFAGDDGTADPALMAALSAHLGGAAGLGDVVAALTSARVLVPVLARLEAAGVTADGLEVDKEASAGVVAVRVPDGRAALPVFTSVASMQAWRPEARPVTSSAPRAAVAALAEGWEALLFDPAGPVAVVLPRTAVRALATGRPWRPAVEGGQVRPDVRAAVVGAVAGMEHVTSVDVRPGRGTAVAVVLGLRDGLDRSGLDEVLTRVGAALAAQALVVDAVDALEVRVERAP